LEGSKKKEREMKPVRVAILGASGWMGKVHSMAFQTFPQFLGTADGTARIVSVVVNTPAALPDLAVQAPGARVLTDWMDAVKDPEVDLIDICLPDSLHYPVAKAALLAGKHVYCEKPLADTAAEAKELADIARQKGLITRVGHAFPRNPVHDVAGVDDPEGVEGLGNTVQVGPAELGPLGEHHECVCSLCCIQ
jgi:predicted dehydrogenase